MYCFTRFHRRIYGRLELYINDILVMWLFLYKTNAKVSILHNTSVFRKNRIPAPSLTYSPLSLANPRAPEIVYQPSLLGIEQAGIAETAAFILSHYPADLQSSMVQVSI